MKFQYQYYYILDFKGHPDELDQFSISWLQNLNSTQSALSLISSVSVMKYF